MILNENLVASGITIVERLVGTAALINKTQAELDSIDLPESWNIKKVSDYCISTKSGSTPSRADSSFWMGGNIPWLKSGEVHNGITLKTEEYITKFALDSCSVKLLPTDTVLMAMYGVTAGEIGYLAVPSTTNQAVCGMICRNSDYAAYLFFALLQNQKAASRLSNGGAQDNLSKNFIDNIALVEPPKSIIKKSNLSSIIKGMKIIAKEIDKLEEFKTVILANLSRN